MSEGDEPPPGQSLVGYGRPPEATRFQKGRSGNPGGRPKRKKPQVLRQTIGDIILTEAYRPIEIRENNRIVKMPMIQAVIRSLGVAAAKGSLKAQLAIASMVETVERRIEDDHRMILEAALDYKRGWEEAFEACDSRGEPRPEPVPHPDEMQFDGRMGMVIFNGPRDEMDAANWDKARENRNEMAEELADYRRALKRTRDPKCRAHYERMIVSNENMVDFYDSLFPDKETRRRPGFHIHEWRERQKRLYELKKSWRERRLSDGG